MSMPDNLDHIDISLLVHEINIDKDAMLQQPKRLNAFQVNKLEVMPITITPNQIQEIITNIVWYFKKRIFFSNKIN